MLSQDFTTCYFITVKLSLSKKPHFVIKSVYSDDADAIYILDRVKVTVYVDNVNINLETEIMKLVNVLAALNTFDNRVSVFVSGFRASADQLRNSELRLHDAIIQKKHTHGLPQVIPFKPSTISARAQLDSYVASLRQHMKLYNSHPNFSLHSPKNIARMQNYIKNTLGMQLCNDDLEYIINAIASSI